MGYESEPLPSYKKLRNCSYSIKLNCTTSLSTPQVHLPRLGPTIAPTISCPASAPPPCTAHRWGGRPTFPIWSPAASWCTPRWGVALWLPLTPLPMGTNTLCLPRIYPSSPWSAAPPGVGTPPGHWEYPPLPPVSRWRTRAPTAPPPYTYDLSNQCCLEPVTVTDMFDHM